MDNKTWKNYYEKTKNSPPRPLLVQALASVSEKGTALDLGSGALNDSMHLLLHGFKHVTAVDKELVAKEVAATLPGKRFAYVEASFDNFQFPVDQFNLVNAQFSLPFNPPHTFSKLISNVYNSLKPEGIFVGTLFGLKDDWNTPASKMTFHSVQSAKEALAEFEMLHFKEFEEDKATAAGEMKHWQFIYFIVKK